MRVLVVGAGFSGAVIARELAQAGHEIVVIDERDVVAGNCHTERDAETGIMVHVHGPHIFHTNSELVWDYVRRFAEMMPYRHRVRAHVAGQVYSLPINLHTINQFFRRALSPAQAKILVDLVSVRMSKTAPGSLEEYGLSVMGEQLYQAFIAAYTRKQWGVEPSLLPAEVLKRLPLRFTYDDDYFDHRYQALPKDGYTAMVTAILDHPRIRLKLGLAFERIAGAGLGAFDHIVYSGPIDRYHDRRFGGLSYRTLDFERFVQDGDFQGVAVMNYCDAEVRHTRITEHRHFAWWERRDSSRTVCFLEYSRPCGPTDIPYYPLRFVDDRDRLGQYVALSRKLSGVTFVGRLGTYSYLDMDAAILRALETARVLKVAFLAGKMPPVFVHAPF